MKAKRISQDDVRNAIERAFTEEPTLRITIKGLEMLLGFSENQIRVAIGFIFDLGMLRRKRVSPPASERDPLYSGARWKYQYSLSENGRKRLLQKAADAKRCRLAPEVRR